MRKYATAKKVNREIQQSGDHLISVQHLKREQIAQSFYRITNGEGGQRFCSLTEFNML